MSAAATTADPPPQPGPAAAAVTSRFAPLLTLVRKLIDYGRELATTLRERNDNTAPTAVVRAFGITDLPRIIARIMCGLHRAEALEQKIVRTDARPDAPPGPQAARSPRTPRADRPAVPRASQPDPDLLPLPTPEQIAAKIRHQPIGAVIADICRDLGITPVHPLWRELQLAIILHNGNAARLLIEVVNRAWVILRQALPAAMQAEPAASACATGPP
jgi:hypothetical protein